MSKISPTIRRGRPKLPKDVARSNRVVTFVTDLQMRQLQEFADKNSVSLSTACNDLIAAALNEQLEDYRTSDNGKQKR